MNQKDEFIWGCFAGLIAAVILGAAVTTAVERDDLRDLLYRCKLSHPRVEKAGVPTSKEIMEAEIIE